MSIVKNLEKSTKLLTIPALTWGFLLSACGGSGPVDKLGDITFIYSSNTTNGSSTKSVQEYQMCGNIGNPYIPGIAAYPNDGTYTNKTCTNEKNNTNDPYKEFNNLSDKEYQSKALFFGPIANAALKYQINAINSRANLLRTYFHYLQDDCDSNKSGSCRTIHVTDKNDLRTYFGDDNENKKLFDKNKNSSKKIQSSNNIHTTINDYFFAFFLTNSLRQGDGFSSYPSALEFHLKKIIFDLGDLSNITFAASSGTTNLPSYKDNGSSSNPSAGSSGQGDKIEKFSLSSGSNQIEYLKIPVPRIYYSYGFKLKNNKEVKKNDIKEYLKYPGNSKLIPEKLVNKLDSLSEIDFLVEMAPMAMVAQLKNESKNSASTSSLNISNSTDKNIVFLSDNIIWNSLTSQTNDATKKLYGTSLISLSKSLDYNLSVGFSQRQAHFDNYISYNHNFPNNNKVTDYLKNNKTIFSSDNNGISDNKLFNFKKIKDNKVSNLLFTFFNDFKFNDEYNNISYVNNSSSGSSALQQNPSWITLKKGSDKINELKNSNQSISKSS